MKNRAESPVIARARVEGVARHYASRNFARDRAANYARIYEANGFGCGYPSGTPRTPSGSIIL